MINVSFFFFSFFDKFVSHFFNLKTEILNQNLILICFGLTMNFVSFTFWFFYFSFSLSNSIKNFIWIIHKR